MENEHTVNGLIRKRAELAGLLEHHQSEVRRLIIDIDNLDATIRLFAPDIDLAEIKPKPLPPRQAAYKGEVARVILGALRNAHHPMTATELAQHFMAERGLNTADPRMVRTVTKRIMSSLRHYRTKGALCSIKTEGKRTLWKIS